MTWFSDIPAMYLLYTWPGGQLQRPAPQRAATGALARLRYTPGTCAVKRAGGDISRGAKASSNHVTVRPPRLRQPHRVARRATRWSPRPSSASLPAGRGSGTPGPLRSVTSTRITSSAILTATVTVSPGAPEPLCRRLLEKSSPTSRVATSPHGWPEPSSPSTNARASLARSARPASVTVSRTASPAISAPAFPAAHAPGITRAAGRTQRDARSTRRQTSRQGRPRNGHRNPVKRLPTPLLAPIPVRYASVDTATQRPTALQGDTCWDREETPR